MTAKAAPSCLSESQLRELIAGEMNDHSAAEARNHLATCAECSARQAGIQSDLESWVAQLRAAGPPRLGGEMPKHTERDEAIAQLLAGYQIVEEIGRGGQGIVYRALQVSTHREVALKVLREGPFASRDERRRFEREVELVAGLNHPCIVTVFDSGEMRDGRPYCVMDLVDGLPIDLYLEQSKCTLAELIRLFADVCDGVNYAHQRGVIHRDIKPSNILIDSQGRPRILDFGLAKTMNRSDRSVVTAEGLVAGTIPYLAPEQAQGRAENIDIRTDVYGLGIVFYRLLYGDFPYPVDSDLSAVLRHISETPPMPRAMASQFSKYTADLAVSRFITDELSTIVSKSLAKSRERRYQTAGDFGADLRCVLSNEPIEARRDSRLYLLRSLLRRHRRAATAAIAFVAVIMASVVALGVMYGRQSRLLERVREEKSKAEAAEARATRRFGELRELTRSFIFDLDRMLSNVAGAVPAREFIVQNAMKYLNSLAEDMSDEDPQKLAELTAAHFALGDILGDPQTNSLGRPAEAIVHYRRGIESIEALLRQKPDDSKTMVGLWTGYRRAALMLTTLERAEESQAFQLKAGKLMERMIQLFPDDPSVLRNKIYAMRDEGESLEATGKLEEAVREYRKCLEEADALSGKYPDMFEARHDVAQINSRIGKLCLRLGDTNGALASQTRAVEAFERIVATEPHNARLSLDLAIALDALGQSYQITRELGRAMEHYRKSLALSEKVLVLEPGMIRAKSVRQTAFCRMGEVELALGDYDKAAHTFDRHLKAAQDILAADPSSPAARREVAVAYYKLAELCRARANRDEAGSETKMNEWRAVQKWIGLCKAEFVALDRDNVMAPSDAGVIGELDGELAAAEARLHELETDN